MNEEAENLQARARQLYDLPLFQFTSAHSAELQAVEQKLSDMGYKRVEDSPESAICYVPKNERT